MCPESEALAVGPFPKRGWDHYNMAPEWLTMIAGEQLCLLLFRTGAWLLRLGALYGQMYLVPGKDLVVSIRLATLFAAHKLEE